MQWRLFMNPVETQVAEYFSWLDSEVGQLEPVQFRSEDETFRAGKPLMLAVAAAVIIAVVGLAVVNRRPADLAPGGSSDVPTTTEEQSTETSVLSPELEATALATMLSDAGVDTARLPDSMVEAITDVATGATYLCGLENPESPTNGSLVAVNTAARRCFLDRYLIGSPAVLVLQGPTYLNAPGISVWSTHADRTVSINGANGQDDVWTTVPCGGISTDPVGSADPPEYFHCTDVALTLVADEAKVPDWFVERASLPLCGYLMPSSESDSATECFADALVDGTPAEYVTAAADGRSAAWMRTLDKGLYERIDWRVSADDVISWARSRCARSDTPDASIPVFGRDGSYTCETT